MANKPKATKPAPEVADTSTTSQAAAEQAAKEAADQAAKPDELESEEQPIMCPRVLRTDDLDFDIRAACANMLATVIHLVDLGYPVVLVQEPEGAYRAMLAAFGPMLTGPVGLDVEQAMKNLEEATPEILAGFKATTGEDMPARPLEGCVAGELTLEQYLAQPANEWAPYWGPKPEKAQVEAGQHVVELPKGDGSPLIDQAGTGYLQDESAIRVYLTALGDKTTRAHQERRPGWLARARRKRDGKQEYIHLELIQNPDAPMMDQAANARAANERGALNGQVASWQRECKDLMDDIVNRLKTVSGDEEVRAELFEALQNGDEWEGRQPKDAEVRTRCLEHLRTIDAREEQIAKAEARLNEIEATLSEQRQEAQTVLDLKLPVSAELMLHVNK